MTSRADAKTPPKNSPAARAPKAQRPSAPLASTLRTKGVVTIPQALREQLDLHEGDSLLISVEDGRLILTPAALVPRDQQWFFTPEWQAKEAEADADLTAGHFTRYGTDDAFLKALED
jgi:antitoxin PrlF